VINTSDIKCPLCIEFFSVVEEIKELEKKGETESLRYSRLLRKKSQLTLLPIYRWGQYAVSNSKISDLISRINSLNGVIPIEEFLAS
jgi:hypothetical protein